MTEPTYGPHNPHPLSQRKTELIWEGKFDEYGNRREVDLAGTAMPLQKIETVDEPRQRALVQGNFFDEKIAHRDDFRNMLVWGDNKLVMASLLKDYKGKIDLIYIDPPFNVEADFKFNVPIGDDSVMEKDQSILEAIAYKDTWGKGTDSYLCMMSERLMLLKELLNEEGTIFVHCDYRMNSFLRLILEDVFGPLNYQNQITWRRTDPHNNVVNRFGVISDTIFFFSKTQKFNFYGNNARLDLSDAALKEYSLGVVRKK